MNLRAHALAGIRWTAAENVLNAVFGIASVAILARLLAPQDFGLMAIVVVVLAFSQIFADLGISNAILHRQDVDDTQLNTLYWANVLAGLVVYGLVVLAAWPVAHFYQEPRLAPIIIVAGLGTLLQSFGQQFSVLLRKHLQFDLLAKIGIASRFAGLLVAIALASRGFGVHALVYSSLVTTALASALAARAGMRLHKPRLEFRPARVKAFFSFGAYQMGEGALNYLNANLDSALIGRLAGAEALGLYVLAKQFVMYPAQIVGPMVTRVALPVMARVQDDLPRLRAIYLQTINHLSSLNFPVYAAIAVFAGDLTAVLFGSHWAGAAPLMRILAVYAALRSVGSPVGALILARGQARLAFWWNAGLLLLVPVAIFIGAQGGAIGIAWALLAMQVVLMLPNWYLLVRPLCGARFREYHLQIARPAAAALAGALAAWLVAGLFASSWGRLVAGTASGALVTLAIYGAWNREFLGALRAMVSRTES